MTPLTDAEKVDLRRYCGYPAYGAASAGLQTWRFFQVYGLLEFRLGNLSSDEIIVARRFLGTLATLESAVPAASTTLDTDQAATWTRNKDEVNQRLQLFDSWRRRLCGFLGVSPGPALSNANPAWVV